MRIHYRIDDFQETYFVIRNLDEQLDLAHIDFGPIYERVKGQPASESIGSQTSVRPRSACTLQNAQRTGKHQCQSHPG